MARFGHYQDVQVEFSTIPEPIEEPENEPTRRIEETRDETVVVRPPSKQESDDFITKGKKREDNVLIIGDENDELISDN